MDALESAQQSPKLINEDLHLDSETKLSLVNATGIEATCVSSMLVNSVGQQISLAYVLYAIPKLLPKFTDRGCAPFHQFSGSRPDLITDPSIFSGCTPHGTSLPIIKVDPCVAISIVNMDGEWDVKGVYAI
jgi:hypothetical protein